MAQVKKMEINQPNGVKPKMTGQKLRSINLQAALKQTGIKKVVKQGLDVHR
jgi:hypothetical protein